MSPFLAWGDFYARLRFARSTLPEEKWGTTRSLDIRSTQFTHRFLFFARGLGTVAIVTSLYIPVKHRND